MARTLKDTFRALKNRKMLFLLFLGMSSGLPFSLTLGTLQAWMVDVQIDLKTIGLFAFLRLPFSLKFLWSPFMDRFAPKFLDRRRGWAFLAQVILSILIAFMAVTDPTTQIKQLLVLTLLVNFFSASQDIVLDAYRREVLKDEELGIGVGVFINGYLIAMRFISGAFALLLPKFMPWSSVYLIMASFMALGAVATVFAPHIIVRESAPKTLGEAFVGPLKEYFSRPTAFTMLAFVVLYKIGDALAGTMTIPFILQTGFSKEEYVAIVKVWGLMATLAGGMVGGHFVMRMGIHRSLWVMGFFQALSTACFALLTFTGKNNIALSLIVAFENLTAQMGTAAYAAYMASITNIRFTATQFALLSSLMAIPGAIFAGRTGALAETFGWNHFFLGCALAAAPGMFLIPLLDHKNLTPLKDLLRRLIIGITLLAGLYALYANSRDIIKLFYRQ